MSWLLKSSSVILKLAVTERVNVGDQSPTNTGCVIQAQAQVRLPAIVTVEMFKWSSFFVQLTVWSPLSQPAVDNTLRDGPTAFLCRTNQDKGQLNTCIPVHRILTAS